jgi:hypothetical protein
MIDVLEGRCLKMTSTKNKENKSELENARVEVLKKTLANLKGGKPLLCKKSGPHKGFLGPCCSALPATFP